jgi:hypothetical protein
MNLILGTNRRLGLNHRRSPGRLAVFRVGRVAVVGAFVAALGATAACAGPGSGAASNSSESTADSGQAATGTPEHESDNYARVLPIFEKDPAHWGGAYADGDVLVVKFADQSRSQAQATLQSKKIVRGVRLVGVDVSLSDLARAKAAVEKVLSRDSRAVSWGPDYESSTIHVEVTTTDATMLGTLTQAVRGMAPVDVVAGAAHGHTVAR